MWDATVPDTFGASHLNTTSKSAGAAAARAEQTKNSKYTEISLSNHFIPMLSKRWAPTGSRHGGLFLSWASVSHEPQATLWRLHDDASAFPWPYNGEMIYL